MVNTKHSSVPTDPSDTVALDGSNVTLTGSVPDYGNVTFMWYKDFTQVNYYFSAYCLFYLNEPH